MTVVYFPHDQQGNLSVQCANGIHVIFSWTILHSCLVIYKTPYRAVARYENPEGLETHFYIQLAYKKISIWAYLAAMSSKSISEQHLRVVFI